MLRFLNYLLITLTTIILFSCSSDDTKTPEKKSDNKVIKTILLPKKITMTDNSYTTIHYTIDFKYTDDFLISGFILKTTGIELRSKAVYENGKLTHFHNNIDDSNATATLDYNDKNQITSISVPNTPSLRFIYNTKNQVIESNIDHIYKTNFSYDKKGNIEKAKMLITIPGQTEVEQRKYTYDDKNTPFNNTNYSFEVDTSDLFSDLNFIYKPMNNVLTEESDNEIGIDNLYKYKYEYTYNEYDFPITIKKITNSGKILEERTYEYEIHIIEEQQQTLSTNQFH